MGIFEYLYNWSLELVGYTDTVPSEWLLPQFALLLSYILMGITLYATWWLTKWVIKFISSQFPWGM
jgi:hypothetical protein